MISSLRRRIGKRLRYARFRRSVRPTDIFVVTHPKSGTNWVGFFLANAVNEVHDLGRELTLTNFRSLVPDIDSYNRTGGSLDEFAELGDPRIFTTHTTLELAFANVVYVVRDPRDVIVSLYYHRRRREADFTVELDPFVEAAPRELKRWNRHVSAWVERTRLLGGLLVRYEDLHEESEQRFGEIATYCGMDLDPAQLARCIEASAFNRMRSVENTEASENVRPIRFIRKGKAGGFVDELSPTAIATVERECGPLMERLGYAPLRTEGAVAP